MTQRHISVVLIVVGNIALIALIYIVTLAVCAVRGIAIKPEVLTAMKDVGLVSIGALTGLLARTSTGSDAAGTISASPAPGESASLTATVSSDKP